MKTPEGYKMWGDHILLTEEENRQVDETGWTPELKAKANVWDSLEDFLAVYQLMKQGKWSWVKNMQCKYVDLRIDMRDGGCLIYNKDGKRILPEQLAFQYNGKDAFPEASWDSEKEPIIDPELPEKIKVYKESKSKKPLRVYLGYSKKYYKRLVKCGAIPKI